MGAPLGPYIRPPRLAAISGKTREGRILNDTRRALTEHVGGDPTVPQRLLIERAANLTLRIAMMDRKLAAGENLGSGPAQGRNSDSEIYLAWTNTLRLVLRDLGMSARKARPLTLEDVRAAHVPSLDEVRGS